MDKILYEWKKVSEDFSNIPPDETDVFVRFEDLDGVLHKGHGWIDTLDGQKRIRWEKDPVSFRGGGCLLVFMKYIEILSPVEPLNVDEPEAITFSRYLNDYWYYRPKPNVYVWKDSPRSKGISLEEVYKQFHTQKSINK